MKFDSLSQFNIELIEAQNSFDKIRVDLSSLVNLLSFLKNNAEFDIDRLNTIIAVDLGDKFELVYDLYSTALNISLRVSVFVKREIPNAPSVTEVFKSAYFDECEIFDLFGVNFENNVNLKRLYMPDGWIGHPLRKDYVLNDERLAWNEVKNV